MISDPYHNFSLLVSHQGTNPKYTFAFSLDKTPLYQLAFTFPPPWQLEVLRKPALPQTHIPTDKFEVSLPVIEKHTLENQGPELDSHPLLDQFVEDMKKNPLALAQYVYNEIELWDPFLTKKNEVFQAPSIHRSAYGTFLAKQGSCWEQCALLVYLLRKAGYEAQYIEGTCSLDASFVEKLLYLRLSDENTILLNYPGVIFFDGNEWITLFPWMKEMNIQEGHDLYGLMPKEYASADLWIKRYLCNDNNIHKLIGSNGDDTAGGLFTRFVEAQLREKGLSLQDVGTRRTIHKKQFASWSDFHRPNVIGTLTPLSSLHKRDDLFATISIKAGIFGRTVKLASMMCQTIGIDLSALDKFTIIWHGGQNQSVSLGGEIRNWEVSATYHEPVSQSNSSRVFPIAPGTRAAFCCQCGSTTPEIVSTFGKQLSHESSEQEKLYSLFSFIGTAYFEKCSRQETILACLHKVAPTQILRCGLVKLVPDMTTTQKDHLPSSQFPQVDMQGIYQKTSTHQHLCSRYQESNMARRQFLALVLVNDSANEHQILREVYEDPYAISTVKLLQIADQAHLKKSGLGSGFLTFTQKSFSDSDTQPEMARHLYFYHLTGIGLRRIKEVTKPQWDETRDLLQTTQREGGSFSYAYMTPGKVSSQDSNGLRAASFTGIGTLIFSPDTQSALISDGTMILHGGFGSRLPNFTVQNLSRNNLEVISSEGSYKLQPLISSDHITINFSGVSNPSLIARWFPESTQLLTGKEPVENWIMPQWKSDVRQEHKSSLETVSDPVDVVTGAFYVDEVDLTLPGPFQLEVRRNYSSLNPLPGLLGCGWKLSLNPVLYEEEDRIYAAEKDGTVIVYRFDPATSRWIVLPKDNPELRNFNQQGIGGTANPFHAYIVKENGYTLYGSDGSKRMFENQLLKSWKDHRGNTLTFIYDKNRLTRIESSNGGYLGFNYNHEGLISEAYVKDGRRVHYAYDFRGNLTEVLLPNGAAISYEYDANHCIVKETKPHGHVLENIYIDGKVVEQRSPLGSQQQMITSATFAYQDGLTTVKDALGGTTDYKIYQKQIYQVTDPKGYQTFQSWFIDENSYFDAKTATVQPWTQPGGWVRSLKSSTDKRGLTTHYLYDTQGNPQEITLVGEDLTGSGNSSVTKHFVYNAYNLPIIEETLQTKTLTTYDAYLPTHVEKYVGDTLVSTIDLEYTAFGLIAKEDFSGSVTLTEYDSRGFPTKKTQKTGTEDPDVITHFRFNDQGQCLEQMTEGVVQRHDYDIMGNRDCTTTSLSSGKIISKTYAGYDLNNRLSWTQGDDPNDVVFFDYHAAGMVKAKRKNLTSLQGTTIGKTGVAYTLYDYDACGRLIEEVDPLGYSTYHTYDAIGQLASIIKGGTVTEFAYEAGGFVVSVKSPKGAITTREYTTNGLLKLETLPDGSQISYAYDFFGRPVLEEKNHSALVIRYDDAAYQVFRTQQDLTEIYTFDQRNNLICRIDAAGNAWKKSYDGLNRIKTEISPSGDVTTWSYQGDTVICTLPSGEKIIQRYEADDLIENQTIAVDGALISETATTYYPKQSMQQTVSGDVTTTVWTNTLGQQLMVQQGEQTSTNTYDACGNCVVTVDENKNITLNAFDSLGQLIQKTLPDGAIIKYSYDTDSHLVSCEMPNQLRWEASYDLIGRKVSERLNANGQRSQQWQYTYVDGLLTQSKDPLERVHKYTYDVHSRLIQENIDTYARHYTYDPRGLSTSIIETGDNTSKVERAYDTSGRLIQETITFDGNILQQTSQEWTPSSRTLTIGEHQRTLTYQGGRLSNLAANGVNLSYDYSNGLLTRKTTPHATIDIQYNTVALPQRILVNTQSASYKESMLWTPTGKLAVHESTYPRVQSNTYAYDSRGRLKTFDDQAYTFDFGKAGRGILTGAPDWQVLENGLDPFGKIIEEIVHTKNLDTRYDSMGQVIMRGKDQLKWDPWGRLTSVMTDTYTWKASYDALGRRLQTTHVVKCNDSKEKVLVTTSFYDPEQEFLEIGVNYDGKIFWKHYGTLSCDALTDSFGNSLTLLHDVLGNLSAVVSAQATIPNQAYPSVYGPQELPSEEATLLAYAQSLTWQSRRLDPTGLVWLGARYYDPQGGRFLSPDPISHPISLDLYSYANGDPINNFDPNGRFASKVYDITKTTVIDTFSSHRFHGSLRALGGLTEAGVGACLGMVPSPFCITQIGGALLVGHGLDNYQAGYNQAISNQSREPITIQILQKSGISHNAAHMANDLGMILGTMGATGGLRSVPVESPAFRVPLTATKSAPLELNRFHKAAQGLSEVGQNNIRILRGWAKSKGWVKAPNSGGPEIWGHFRETKFEWNLKIKPEASFRSNLKIGSQAPRFDARLGVSEPYYYLNPFTGNGGPTSHNGTHVLLENIWMK